MSLNGVLMQKTSTGGEILMYQAIKLDQIVGMYGYNQNINDPTNFQHQVLV